MTTPTNIAPEHIAVTLPQTSVLHSALAGDHFTLSAGTRLYRAVRHPAAVIPPYVDHTYRFGPPAAFAGPDGRHARFWLYAAADLNTALWESEFCVNDFTQPGTFYIPAAIAVDGLIATFTLQTDLPLLDLNGTVLSRLGIYDRVHGEHAWCQWFGMQMLELLDGFTGGQEPVGFRYPSRKHKNHVALAVQSGALERFRRSVEVAVTPFAQTREFASLRADTNYADPLHGHFSLD
ncbi:RES domain-containing protein [Cupriavidus sp. H18C1]